MYLQQLISHHSNTFVGDLLMRQHPYSMIAETTSGEVWSAIPRDFAEGILLLSTQKFSILTSQPYGK